jgi:hypothetical protein
LPLLGCLHTAGLAGEVLLLQLCDNSMLTQEF